MQKILLLAFVCIAGTCFAQDTIIKFDGGLIPSKVIEITDDNIRYWVWSFQQGPLFEVPVKQVAVIKYANGVNYAINGGNPIKQTRTEKTEPISSEKLLDYSKYDSLMNQSRGNRAVGITCAVGGPVIFILGLTLVGVATVNPSESTGANKSVIAVGVVSIVGGAILTCIAPVCCIKARRQKDIAQRYKPTAYLSIPSPVINLTQGSPGIGIGFKCRF